MTRILLELNDLNVNHRELFDLIMEKSNQAYEKSDYEEMILNLSDIFDMYYSLDSNSSGNIIEIIMEKVKVLFNIRSFAILEGQTNNYRLITSSGFTDEKEILKKTKQNKPNQFLYSFYTNQENCLLFIEQSRLINKSRNHIYNILARNIQNIMLLEKNKKELKQINLERQWTEESMKTSIKQWSSTFDAISDVIFLIDINGRILRCNKALEVFLNKPPKEIIGHDYNQIIYKSAQSPESNLLDKVKKNLRKENTILLLNKQWFSITVYPMLNENNDFIGAVHVLSNITKQKKAEEKLFIYQDQLRYMTSELSLTEERERRRIAVDLHDNIGQTLALSKIKLRSIQKEFQSSEFSSSLSELHRLIEQSIQDTRTIISDLSPPILYELGLESAIEWLIDKMNDQHGLFIEFKNDETPKPLAEDIRVVIFQTIRELMFNIVKHAQVQYAKIDFKVDKLQNLQIKVKDDGIGFDIAKMPFAINKTKGFGLFNIRERLKYLGLDFDIKSRVGHGTIVTIVVPLKYKN